MKFLIASSIANNTGCYARGNYLARNIKKLGYEVDYLKTFKSIPYGVYYLLSIPHNFIRIIFKKFDIGIALKPYPNTILPMLIKKILGAKIIVDIDDLDIKNQGLIKKMLGFIQKNSIKYFDLILVHNSNLYKLVTEDLKINKNKVYQIEQGVDLEIFKNSNNKLEFKREFGYENQKLIVYTGHINVAAHLNEIIKAFDILIKEQDDIKLIIVGGGPNEEEYKKLIKKKNLENKIIITGYTNSTEKIVKYLNIADACVVYYPADEFNKYRSSMKLREYLAVGVPTICNNFGDLARFKSYTYNFETGDINGFKEMMKKAISSPDGRENQGKKFIEENMSWKNIVLGIIREIKKC